MDRLHRVAIGPDLLDRLRCGERCRFVELRHQNSEDDWHVDLMIESPIQGDPRLVTFRLPCPIATWLRDQPVEIERIGDHRAMYLDYEGEISGGRGYVTRLSHGSVILRSKIDLTWFLQAEVLETTERALEDVRLCALLKLTRIDEKSGWIGVLTGRSRGFVAQ